MTTTIRQPDPPAELADQLHLTHRVLRLFTNPVMVELLPALEEVEKRLAKYEPAKQGKWKTQSIDEHLHHLKQHNYQLDPALAYPKGFDTNLTAVIVRGLMALTRYNQLTDQTPDDTLEEIRCRE